MSTLLKTEVDSRSFESLIRSVIDITGKAPETVVRNMARDATRAMWRNTRVAQATPWKRVSAGGQVFWVPKVAGSTRPKRHPRAGFAKAGWLPAMRQLGIISGSKTGKRSLANAAKYSIYGAHGKTWQSEITVGSAIPYIGNLERMDGIEGKGIASAKAQLVKFVKTYERKIGSAR